jgi:hypothetical protein
MTADWKRVFGPNFRKCACTICNRRHKRMHLTLKTTRHETRFLTEFALTEGVRGHVVN